jgi:hypothetical protein
VWLGGVLGLLAGALPASAGAQAPATAPAPRFERAVVVAEPGWVKVPLDPATRGKMRPGGEDTTVRDPTGRALARWLVTGAGGLPASIPGRVVDVAEAADGWRVTVDLGPAPPAHDALRFDFSNRDVAPQVRLAASADGRAWVDIAAASLFRLGSAPDLQQTEVTYAERLDRYLRLDWPRSAGLPRLTDVSAVPSRPAPEAPQPVRLTIEPASGAASGEAAYRLVAPGDGLYPERLDLTWAGSGTVGFRLQQPGGGNWVTVEEGQLRTGRAEPLTVALDLVESPLRGWRLTLRGEPGDRPRLLQAVAQVPPSWLVFDAPRAGRYLVGYSGVSGPDGEVPGREAPPGVFERALTVASEPETALPPRPLPALLASGGALAPEAVEARWSLEAAAARPGELVRLDLWAELAGAGVPADELGLRRLRLESAGRQVPYVVDRPAEPALVAAWQGLQPTLDATVPGRSQLVFAVTPAGRAVPGAFVELSTPLGPFRRPYVARLEPAARGEGSTILSDGEWTCPPPEAATPCRLELMTPATGADQRVVVTFDDGDNAPLPAVDVVVWRSVTELVFPWPGGEVRLVELAGGPEPPQYDLADARGEVLARPSRRAQVVAGPVRRPPPAAPQPVESPPWLLGAALGFAALVMLGVMALLLRPGEVPPEGIDGAGAGS